MPDQGYYRNLRPEMLEFVPLSARTVLEVGCGAGLFAAAVKSRNGAVVWGVEVDGEAADQAAGRLNKVLRGSIEQCELPPSFFDCIVFNDVLEHLLDPIAALRRCRPALKESGIMVLSVPNVRYIKNVVHYLFGGDWRYGDGGILDITHLRFFTRKSLLRMIRELPAQILTIRGINPTRFGIFGLLNLCLFNRISDMRYMQFAVVLRCIEALA